MGVPGLLIGAGAAIQGYGAYKSSRASRSEAKTLTSNALMQGQMLNQVYGIQAGMYANQQRIFNMQADALHQQAELTRKHADTMAAIEVRKAAVAEQQLDRELEQEAKARRIKIGAGLVAFAGNGVLLEARDDSAAAIWERDETADLAAEMVLMKTATERESWGYMRNAFATRIQGEQDAYSMHLQALSATAEAANAASQAGIAKLNAQWALTEAYNAAQVQRYRAKAAKWQMFTDLATISGQTLRSLSALAPIT